MIEEILFTVTRWSAAIGCALMAGVFFAFSGFVMKGLSRLPAEQGIAAMQSINASVSGSVFLAAFLGTAGACLPVIVLAARKWSEPAALYLAGGAALFLIGAFLVTIAINVPMNNALDALPATAPDRTERWSRYVTDWTRWNHVRTIACTLAVVLFIGGWIAERKSPAPVDPEKISRR